MQVTSLSELDMAFLVLSGLLPTKYMIPFRGT